MIRQELITFHRAKAESDTELLDRVNAHIFNRNDAGWLATALQYASPDRIIILLTKTTETETL